MHVEAAVSFEPVLNGWVFMRGVVIDNEMEIKFLRGFPVDLFLRNATTRGGYGTLRSEEIILPSR